MVDICVYRARIGIFGQKVKISNTKSKDMFVHKGRDKNDCNSLIIWVIILSIYSMFRVDTVFQNSINRNSHIVNGNLKNSSRKLLHWNKGPSFLQYKIDHVKYILDKQKPHIFSLSEANYIRSRNNHDIKIDGYNYEWTDQKCNYDISRQVVLVDDRLNYVRRFDLKSTHDCTIWIHTSTN